MRYGQIDRGLVARYGPVRSEPFARNRAWSNLSGMLQTAPGQIFFTLLIDLYEPIYNTIWNKESGPKMANTGLDEFLKEMHGTTEAADASGAPTIGDLKERFKTKSAIIRHLHGDKGMSVKDIAKMLDLKYQHVRNVVHQKLKRGPNEDFHLGEGQAAAVVRDYREFGQPIKIQGNQDGIDADEED